MYDIALVQAGAAGFPSPSDESAEVAGSDRRALTAALRSLTATVDQPALHDPDVDWSRFDVAVVCPPLGGLIDRDALIPWAGRISACTPVCNPPDVLRWNAHRSYLLELEERGAPVVPTAWTAHGDRVHLAALLSARQWRTAVLEPATHDGPGGAVHVGADPQEDQRRLDALLSEGDVLIRRGLDGAGRRDRRSVVVIDGRVTHALRRPADPDGDTAGSARTTVEPVDAQSAALARWIVEATGTPLLYARVELVQDDVGSDQLVELAATAPELHLEAAPDAAGILAEAIIRRVRRPVRPSGLVDDR